MADHIAPALEAILLVAEEPLPPELLAKLVGTSVDDVVDHCESLAAEYEADGRGFVLARVAGGYRYQTATEQAPYVERFVLDGQSARLSAAALETLAVIAYKQPISRGAIASIRAVNVDSVVRTLLGRGPKPVEIRPGGSPPRSAPTGLTWWRRRLRGRSSPLPLSRPSRRRRGSGRRGPPSRLRTAVLRRLS